MNKKSSIILFDIDYTLLNTAKLKNLFNQEICQLLKIEERTLKRLNKEFSGRPRSHIEFSPRRYIDFLQDKASRQFPEFELINLFFKKEIYYQTSLYSETIPVLRRLKKKFSLGIFSEGVEEFQRAKLELSGLMDYLNKKLVFIYGNKMGKAQLLVKKIEKAYIIDDDPKHIAVLAEIKDVSPIWVKRGP